MVVDGVSPSNSRWCLSSNELAIIAKKVHRFSGLFVVYWLTMAKLHGGIHCVDDTNNSYKQSCDGKYMIVVDSWYTAIYEKSIICIGGR